MMHNNVLTWIDAISLPTASLIDSDSNVSDMDDATDASSDTSESANET